MKKVISILNLSLLILVLLSGCDSKDNSKAKSKSPRIKSISKVSTPKNGSSHTLGQPIAFEITVSDSQVDVDSMVVSFEGRTVASTTSPWENSNESTGIKNLLITVHLNNGKVEKKRHTLTLLSDLTPVKYTYRLINTYPHDPDAFTQGLLMDNNTLYESTGEKGRSTLRKVDLQSGKVMQSINISAQYFGEGIGIIDDKLYMLSWKERTGFVYDKNSLEQINQFAFASEGWGMTSNEDTLIMSDGTHVIRFMEPQGFSEYRQIEVYDQNGPIDFLNELEFVDGDLYAIRWQTELIYRIDPKTGRVKGILDLTGLFDYTNYQEKIDVLNGIAYNPETKTYYITGKWWPNLFEIEIIEANNS